VAVGLRHVVHAQGIIQDFHGILSCGCLPRSLVFHPQRAGSHRSILFHQPIRSRAGNVRRCVTMNATHR
jgi:hypothetical protein